MSSAVQWFECSLALPFFWEHCPPSFPRVRGIEPQVMPPLGTKRSTHQPPVLRNEAVFSAKAAHILQPPLSRPSAKDPGNGGDRKEMSHSSKLHEEERMARRLKGNRGQGRKRTRGRQALQRWGAAGRGCHTAACPSGAANHPLCFSCFQPQRRYRLTVTGFLCFSSMSPVSSPSVPCFLSFLHCSPLISPIKFCDHIFMI